MVIYLFIFILFNIIFGQILIMTTYDINSYREFSFFVCAICKHCVLHRKYNHNQKWVKNIWIENKAHKLYHHFLNITLQYSLTPSPNIDMYSDISKQPTIVLASCCTCKMICHSHSCQRSPKQRAPQKNNKNWVATHKRLTLSVNEGTDVLMFQNGWEQVTEV